jgi:hypothetical protein
MLASGLLDASNNLPPLEQVGGEGIPEGVKPYRFCDPGLSHGMFHGLLDQARIDVVSALLPCAWGQCGDISWPGRWEASQAPTRLLILLVKAVNLLEMHCALASRQQGPPILAPLPIPDSDLPALEIQILHPQSQGFHQA